MSWFVLTGAPGCGKTAILRQLEVDGFAVVEEAATDVIARWHASGRAEESDWASFVDDIVALQLLRQRAAGEAGVTFFDRSPVCTLALCRFLGRPAPRRLVDEVARVAARRPFGSSVFFVRNQGFVAPTAARRISFADAVVFEQVHEQTYREWGFELVEVPAGPLAERVAVVERAVGSHVGGGVVGGGVVGGGVVGGGVEGGGVVGGGVEQGEGGPGGVVGRG